MTELALILVSTVLVNNFVLVKFLGLCPFMGVRMATTIGLGTNLNDGFRTIYTSSLKTRN